ncbi:MAG: NifU family protein [Epsilonproteobacteria bacterium]|nr:MAG: NifU family protein [Campylobacterota bacterium]
MSMPFTDEDLQAPVSELIKTKIAPMMAQDGGAIELMQIKDGRVFVQLQGNCNGCAASSSTLKFIVEKNLKEFIHPDISVVNVLPGMEEEILNG